ncbi:MAG: hypothetical protein IKU37_05760 [Candidatus Gastranaerophilales bacterium]|nr:hypothetical protein [Candidatus Gastranaerophilales bacterium]
MFYSSASAVSFSVRIKFTIEALNSSLENKPSPFVSNSASASRSSSFMV